MLRKIENIFSRLSVSWAARRLARQYRQYASSPDFDPRIPPPEINYNQDASKSLQEYIRKFRHDSCSRELPFLAEKAGLTPASTVLDYGCGLGRFAFAASNFLTSGRYVGYEPNQRALRFLKSAYAARSNFSFRGEELHGAEDYVGIQLGYASSGGVSASAIDLTDLNGLNADVQYSSSVFTHMWIPAIENVLAAFRGVMAGQGTCVNSWLIVDSFAEYGMRCGIADRTLPHEVNGALTYSLHNPLLCTAYRLEQVRDIYQRGRHEILEICWGAWSGRQKHNSAHYQDLVISRPC